MLVVHAVQDIFFSIEISEPDENNADMNNVYKVAVLKLNEHFTPHTNVTYKRSVLGLCVSYWENRLINT